MLRQQRGDVLQFPLQPQQGRENGHHLVKGGLVEIPADVLLHIAQHSVLAKGDRARVRAVLAGEDLKERGLAGAVDAH